ncbi:hypothetical protein SDC9_189505 [bioreactor metagenome]|uniref:Uncharacterized protein n=1 Tax=bioreactor metagenome TaxID=1076179 RepID=A0A645HSW9_9ZZZZ
MKKIKKNGPGYAQADIEIHVEIKSIGKPKFFALSGPQDMENRYRYGDQPPKSEEAQPEIDTKTYSYTWDFTMTQIQLVKMGGQWKIARTNGLMFMSDGKLVEG